jgi:cytosine/adenosine deaminase-related metal-dependent hydrolase
MTVVRVRHAWLPHGIKHGVAVEVADEDGTILDVRPGGPDDGPLIDGLLVPGLINAHTHLELSHLRRRVPGGHGFVAWLRGLHRALGPAEEVALAAEHADASGAATARVLSAGGTAYVLDVSNQGHTGPWLRDAGLRGVVHHELIGLDRRDLASRIALARACNAVADPDVVVRPSPHALFSTALELVDACVRSGPPDVPSTIHVGEAEDEAVFLREGTGPFAELLDALGRDWRWWTPPGEGPLQVLDGLGLLGPDLLLVHAVQLDREAIALAAARDAPVCFCPRSNLHIGGRLPDVPAWLASGVRCALGTDALASNDDVDVLGEIPVLAQAFPQVPAARWLALVTHEGAAAVRADRFGRLERGARSGLLLLDVGSVEDVTKGPVERIWLVRPQ